MIKVEFKVVRREFDYVVAARIPASASVPEGSKAHLELAEMVARHVNEKIVDVWRIPDEEVTAFGVELSKKGVGALEAVHRTYEWCRRYMRS